MTLSILLALAFEQLTSLQIDAYLGLIIACYIMASGIQSLLKAISKLLGKKPQAEDIKAMVDIIESYDHLLDYHDLDVHSYGPAKNFASVHIEVDARMSLVDAHYLVNQIEEEFEHSLQTKLVCHIDPIILNDEERNKIHQRIKTLLHSYQPPLKFHDFRVVKLGQDIDKILFNLVVPESVSLNDEKLYDKITADIHRFLPGVDVDIRFDRNDILYQAKADYKEEN